MLKNVVLLYAELTLK